jgi:predicted amidohydrolase
MKLAAGQIYSLKGRLVERLKDEPVKRNEYFQKYNICAGTYDPAYCRAYGEEYLTYLEEQVKIAANQGAELLLLPEFTFVLAVMAQAHPSLGTNPNALADAIKLYTWSGKYFTEWMKRQSKATGMLLAAATTTIRANKLYNTGLLTDEHGQLALRYEKIHLPHDEIQSVQVGRHYKVADTRLGRIAFSICYDIQFPEHQACLAVAGAQIVLHPSGGYTGPGEAADMGQNRLRVRACDHHMALVYACFAKDPCGCMDSCVIAPNGDVKACIRGTAEGIAMGEVTGVGKGVWPNDKPTDPDREEFRRRWRRPETYRPLLQKVKIS